MSDDSGFPDRDQCVVGPLLERQAAERGNEIYAVFESGGQWSFADTLREVRRTAAALQALGVQQDDHVLSWLPNGSDALRVWYGANVLGAAYVPINTAYRGKVLEHVIANSGAKVMICHGRLLERLAEIDTSQLETVVVIAQPTGTAATRALQILPEEALTGNSELLRAPQRPVQPWDLQTIIYTSGTTGPSKGVLSSYLHQYTTGMVAAEGRFRSDDRYLVNLPLFHAGGTLGTYAMLALGGSIAVVGGFETAKFWDVIKSTGTTTCTLLGVMATFLAKQSPSAADRDHPLRSCYMVPLTEDAEAFAKRFGVDVYTVFNMTEVSCPLISERNPVATGTCGRVRDGIEARIVDEFDREVPAGAVGELIVRADQPWTMNHGYNAMPEATAKAWRNGWFHTGDAFRRDEQDNHYFVDRFKDTIRRRGENVSSFEVEAELLQHPAVREAAAVAVASEYGEDEILAVVAPVDGQVVDPVELVEFLRSRTAYFMVPRYVRIMADLPKTPTNKILKHVLRTEAITDDTWDREGAGIRVAKERFT